MDLILINDGIGCHPISQAGLLELMEAGNIKGYPKKSNSEAPAKRLPKDSARHCDGY